MNFTKMYLVSRTVTFVKLFFFISFIGLFMYIALAFYSFRIKLFSQLLEYQNFKGFGNVNTQRYIGDLKYILIWTVNNYNNTENEGEAPFVEHDCTDLNCYITSNKNLLNGYYANFDAIIFNLSIQSIWEIHNLPKYRHQHQKYVFYSKLPSEEHPICSVIFDDFFNWTWTYKLDSDIISPFIEVKDLECNVVAPSTDVIWTKNIEPLKKDLIKIDEINTDSLSKKTVVWIMNNCNHKSARKLDNYMRKFRKALEQYSLIFDVYGCQNKECPKEGHLDTILKDYYFYLVFECSISSDYVTDEIIKAYDHNIIPIVYGRADYVNFLPDGSYINARNIPAKKLAILLFSILRNQSRYREYFQWKTQYTVNKVDDYQDFCKLCSLLNDKQRVKSFSTYENFRRWWYQGSLKKNCFPKGADKYSDILTYVHTPRYNF